MAKAATETVADRTWRYLAPAIPGQQTQYTLTGIVAKLKGAGFKVVGTSENEQQVTGVCKRCTGELVVDIRRGFTHCFGCGFDAMAGSTLLKGTIMRETTPLQTTMDE